MHIHTSVMHFSDHSLALWIPLVSLILMCEINSFECSPFKLISSPSDWLFFSKYSHYKLCLDKKLPVSPSLMTKHAKWDFQSTVGGLSLPLNHVIKFCPALAKTDRPLCDRRINSECLGNTDVTPLGSSYHFYRKRECSDHKKICNT